MGRKNIYDILQSIGFDLKTEYTRLYISFYDEDPVYLISIEQLAEEYFSGFSQSFVRRCISLDDFDKTYGFNFKRHPDEFDIDYFLLFCEYTYNICIELQGLCHSKDKTKVNRFVHNVLDCIDNLGYKEIEKDGVSIFVEANPEALAVAEIVDEDLSFRVLEYNHHKLKGDLDSKKIILKLLADDIELKRGALSGINRTFTNQLFELMNKFIRHDSSDNEVISNMEDEKLEEIYDDIYQMWLLAKLQLDHLERKGRVEAVLTAINH